MIKRFWVSVATVLSLVLTANSQTQPSGASLEPDVVSASMDYVGYSVDEIDVKYAQWWTVDLVDCPGCPSTKYPLNAVVNGGSGATPQHGPNSLWIDTANITYDFAYFHDVIDRPQDLAYIPSAGIGNSNGVGMVGATSNGVWYEPTETSISSSLHTAKIVPTNPYSHQISLSTVCKTYEEWGGVKSYEIHVDISQSDDTFIGSYQLGIMGGWGENRSTRQIFIDDQYDLDTSYKITVKIMDGSTVIKEETYTASLIKKADWDGDGDVDGDDLLTWQIEYGGDGPKGDADCDGDVDGADYTIWQTEFNNE